MACPTSAETTPRLSSQSKKVSPASPDQSVPSQSKAATRGWRLKTDFRNCSPAEWIVPVLVIFMHFEHNVSRGKCAIAEEVENDGMSGSHQGIASGMPSVTAEKKALAVAGRLHYFASNAE